MIESIHGQSNAKTPTRFGQAGINASKPPHFAGDDKPDSAKPSPEESGASQDRFASSDKDDQAGSHETVGANLSENEKKMGKAYFYQAVVPLLASVFWTPVIGLVLGPLVGAPIAYLSGKKGRKLSREAQNLSSEQERLLSQLSGGSASSLNQMGDKLDLMMESMAAAKYPGLLNKIVPRAFEALAKLHLGQNNSVKAALRYATQNKKMAKNEASSEKFGFRIRILGRAFKGADINLRVASEDNVFKAGWAGAKGLAQYGFIAALGPLGWPFIIVQESIKWLKDKKGDSPKPDTPA